MVDLTAEDLDKLRQFMEKNHIPPFIVKNWLHAWNMRIQDRLFFGYWIHKWRPGDEYYIGSYFHGQHYF